MKKYYMPTTLIRPSKYSVHIKAEHYKYSVYGYRIKKIPFHGLIRNSLDQFLLYLSKYLAFLSISISSTCFHMYCAVNNESDNEFPKERMWLDETLKSLSDALPRDLEIEKISGYEIELSPYTTIEFQGDAIYNSANNSYTKFLIVKSLEILSSPVKFVQGFLELKNCKVILNINNQQKYPTYHLVFSCSGSSIEEVDNTCTKIIKLLNQVPSITGKLVFAKNKFTKNSFASLSFGLTKYEISRSPFTSLMQLIGKQYQVDKSPEYKNPYPKAKRHQLLVSKDVSVDEQIHLSQQINAQEVVISSHETNFVQNTKYSQPSLTKEKYLTQQKLDDSFSEGVIINQTYLQTVVRKIEERGWKIIHQEYLLDTIIFLNIQVMSVKIPMFYIFENLEPFRDMSKLHSKLQSIDKMYGLVVYEKNCPQGTFFDDMDMISVIDFLHYV